MRKTIAVLFITVLLKISATAQIKIEATPASIDFALSKKIPELTLTAPRFVNQSTNRTAPVADYAGEIIDVDDNVTDNGKWEVAENGVDVWRLTFTVEGSYKINIFFKNFYLEPGDLLFVYPAAKPANRALTDVNNGKYLTTDVFNTNSLTVELDRTSESKQLPFEISGVGVIKSDYGRDFGESGFCEIPVNCSEGDDYKKQKNGVARILVKEGSSLFWCTGSLINNTENNGKQYFLTANHCGQNAGEADYSQWHFDFNFESPDCNRPETEPEKNSVSGAELLASAPNSTSLGSDFKLLLLKQQIPENYKPYFNGWDRSGNISNNGVTIHHPQGDIKMISTYTSPLVPTDYYGTTSNGEGYFWMVKWSDTENGHGVTEGGSSGSPIFSSDGLIIGALTGGDASCNQPVSPDYYGRFWASWNPPGSDSTGQLAYWLDPAASQEVVLPGYDPYAGEATPDFTSSIRKLPEGGATTFKNLSSGNITNYKWTFDGGEPSTSTEKNPPEIVYRSKGKYNVKLTVTYDGGTKTLTKEDYIEVLSPLYPNPSNSGKFTILTGDYIKEDITLQIFNETGQEIDILPPVFASQGITIDLSNKKRGIYFVRMINGGDVHIYKVLVTMQQ
jgi:hypothetical protein